MTYTIMERFYGYEETWSVAHGTFASLEEATAQLVSMEDIDPGADYFLKEDKE